MFTKEKAGKSVLWDIYSRLLRDRIVFIGTPIDDYVANSIIAQLLFLQMEDPKKGYSCLHQLTRRKCI